jgi:type III restriction enzyme
MRYLSGSEIFVKALADYMAGEDSDFAKMPRSSQEQIAGEKVIVVISKAGDQDYKAKLDQIEENDPNKVGGKVEFIFAVNKLSEGWDVDNVFQIVPMEERVFNSKLLISQVLGRSLRIPRQVDYVDIKQNYPVVTITNHEKFASHIQELLDQVAECDTIFTSDVFKTDQHERFKHNFNLLNIEYNPTDRTESVSADHNDESYSSRTLKLVKPAEKLGLTVDYKKGRKKFSLSKDFFTLDEIVNQIDRKFTNIGYERTRYDFGGDLDVGTLPDRESIRALIQNAMQQAGIKEDKLSKKNKQTIELHFNQYLPKKTKKVIRENIDGKIIGTSTAKMRRSSVRTGNLDRDASVFMSEDYDNEIDKEDAFVMDEMEKKARQLNLDDEWLEPTDISKSRYLRQFVPYKNIFIANTSLFKTPQDLVIASHEPERKFIIRLIENSKLIDSWVKSPDSGFYSLDYEYWKKGKDRVRRSFNPDFFIKIDIADYLEKLSPDAAINGIGRLRNMQDQGFETIIMVIEIKADEDQTEKTIAKEQAGLQHFQLLNTRLQETNPIDLEEQYQGAASTQRYIFKLLRPKEYASWFSRLRNGLFVMK